MTAEERPPALTGAIRVERAERYPVNAQGMVEGISVIRQNVTIVNLSRSGCLISCRARLSIDERLSIFVPRIGRRSARISRIEGHLYGCAFDMMLDLAEVDAATAHIEPDDVAAMRRRIRETVARGEAATADAPPAGLRARLGAAICRLRRRPR